jgi:hypothetical protein
MVLRLDGIWVACKGGGSGDGKASELMSPRDGAVLVTVQAPCRAWSVGVLRVILAVLFDRRG